MPLPGAATTGPPAARAEGLVECAVCFQEFHEGCAAIAGRDPTSSGGWVCPSCVGAMDVALAFGGRVRREGVQMFRRDGAGGAHAAAGAGGRGGP